MSMFEQIGDMLSAGDAPDMLAKGLGTDSSTAMSGAAAVIPALLGSTAQRSSTKGGAAALFDLVKDNDGSILDNLGGLFGADHSDAEGPSNMLVDGLLGGSKGSIIEGLAKQSGVGGGMIGKLLPMLAPMVMGFLGKRQSAGGLDAAGLAGELGGEWTAMEDAGMGETLGLLGNASADDDTNFSSKLGKLAGIGGLAGLAGAGAAGLTGAAPSGVDGLKGAASGVTGKAAGAAGAATAGASGLKGKAAGVTAAPQPTGGEKKGGLMKWLPLLLIIPLIALLAWACNSGDSDDNDASGTTEAVATTEAMEEEAEPTTTEAMEEEDAMEDEAMEEDAMEEEPEEEAAPAGWIEGNLMDTMDKSGQLGTLVGVIDASGNGPVLEADGPFTVFAPTDEAIAALPEEVTGDPAVLQRVLAYHVVTGNVTSADLVDGPVPTLGGESININTATATVNGANIVETDLTANNGVVHIIDRVLLPADLQAQLGGSLNEALGLEPINFEVNSAVITADSTGTLDRAAEFLITNNTVVEIAGHTDSDGDDAFNQQLSQDRADAVMAYLTDQGVPAENMTAVGYGEDQPVAENDTPENKAKNRRIEFVSAAS